MMNERAERRRRKCIFRVSFERTFLSSQANTNDNGKRGEKTWHENHSNRRAVDTAGKTTIQCLNAFAKRDPRKLKSVFKQQESSWKGSVSIMTTFSMREFTLSRWSLLFLTTSPILQSICHQLDTRITTTFFSERSKGTTQTTLRMVEYRRKAFRKRTQLEMDNKQTHADHSRKTRWIVCMAWQ